MKIIKVNCKKHGIMQGDNISKAGFENNIQLYRCKLCKKIARDKNYKKNPNIVKDRVKAYKTNNPDNFKRMRKVSAKKYQEKHKEKISVYRKKYEKKGREDLSDRYIKHELCKNTKLKFNQIPQNLIDFKKIVIKLKRKIKIIANNDKINKSLEEIESE